MQSMILRANLIIAVANLLLIGLLGWMNRTEARQELAKIIDKRNLKTLILLLILGLALRAWLSPHEPQVFTDEWAFRAEAETIAKGTYGICEYGRQEDCISYGLPTFGPEPAYPIFIALANAMLGHTKQASYIFSLLFSTLTVGLAYIIYRLAFEKEKGAALAGLVFAMLPLSIIYATTASKDSAAAFFFAASIAAMLLANRTKKEKAIYLSAALAGMALNSAIGYVMLLPVLFLLNRNGAKKLIGPGILLIALYSLSLFIGLSMMEKDTGEGTAIVTLRASEALKNLMAQARYWTIEGFHSPLLILFAAYYSAAGRKNREYLALLAWLMIPIIFFVVHKQNLGCDMNRHMLFNYPALSIMAAAGAAMAKERLGGKIGNAVVLLAILSLALYLPAATKNNECYEVHQKEVEFLRNASRIMGDDCVIMTTQPPLTEIETNRRVIELMFAKANEQITNELIGDCLLLYESSDCNTIMTLKKELKKGCHDTKAKYGLAVLAEQELRQGEYARIYRMSEKRENENYAIEIAGLEDQETRRFHVPLALGNESQGIKASEGSVLIRENLSINACEKAWLFATRQGKTLIARFEPEKGCDKKCYATNGTEAGCSSPVSLEIRGLAKGYAGIDVYAQDRLVRKEKIN